MQQIPMQVSIISRSLHIPQMLFKKLVEKLVRKPVLNKHFPISGFLRSSYVWFEGVKAAQGATLRLGP